LSKVEIECFILGRVGLRHDFLQKSSRTVVNSSKAVHNMEGMSFP
jgi:hypothetical protein